MNLVRAALAEAIGTFAFFTIGFLTLVGATAIGQGSALVILLTVPFGFGLGLFAAIWMFGHVSGGHFNPAVTLAAVLDSRIGIVDGIVYVIAQLVGGLGAAFAIFFVHSQDAVGATTTSPGLVTEGQAFAVEAILSAIFIAVILTVTRRQANHAAFVIGLTLIVIHFAAIPFSGASVNPARSLAPAIVSGKLATTSIWIYLTAPFLGSIVGWAIYRFFSPLDEGEDEEEAEEDEDEDEELYEEELDETSA